MVQVLRTRNKTSFPNFSATSSTSYSAVMVRLVALASASTAVFASASAATAATAATDFKMTFTNACSVKIDLYTRLASVYTDMSESIAPGASVVKTIGKDHEGHYRNGSSDAATLIEIATIGDLKALWFDIGIIPPSLNSGFEFCKNLDECKQNSKSGIGFNTPVQITPTSNTNGKNCRELTCLADGCEDAYNFPQDDTKTHSCQFGTNLVVTFCPSGTLDSSSTTQRPVDAKTTDPETPAASETPANTTETPAPELTTPTLEVTTPTSEVTTSTPEVTPAATPKHCV